jgi:phosphatidylinositol glycan class N
MARLGRHGFLAVAVIFHLTYIYSIFDIYFVSPIVHGMREFEVPGETAPAQRLVLYVGAYSACHITCQNLLDEGHG